MRQQAKPFIKWAGGKSRLIDQLDTYFPTELKSGRITQYFEPFLGSGAVFFAIAQKYKIQKAYLSDINPKLINLYATIQQKPTELITVLDDYQKQYNQLPPEQRSEMFALIRKKYNEYSQTVPTVNNPNTELAAYFVYLNKTCFNGLFRLNSKGQFNVPFGKYASPLISDPNNIILASRLLAKAELSINNYAAIFPEVSQNSFIYMDPPYRPLSKTASFTAYTGENFTDTEQIKLAEFVKKLTTEKQAKIMLSNSDPSNSDPNDTFFQQHYPDTQIHKISAARAINSDPNKRGKITELLITNYTHERQTLGLNF